MSAPAIEADLQSHIPVTDELPDETSLITRVLERIIPGHDVSAFNSSI